MSHTAVCTLFERDYHYGLGALTNSLYRHGYRGVVWAGYRGVLPPWTGRNGADGEHDFAVAPGLTLRFVPVDTNAHLTNYKPDFMQQVWERGDPGLEAVFYIDPDIVIKNAWSYFEQWVSYGVALCEDVNSPLPASHPLRHQWRDIYRAHGVALETRCEAYVNGGFVGVSARHRGFLELWQRLQGIMADYIGGLGFANMGAGGPDRTNPFAKTDQDAMNIALMVGWDAVSIAGKDAMDFAPGGCLMSHAIGQAKPWRKRMTLSALGGVPPSLPDKLYLQHAEGPISLYSPLSAKLRRIDAAIGSAIGRVMRRG